MAQEFITRIDAVHLNCNEMARQHFDYMARGSFQLALWTVVHSIGPANKDQSINYKLLASFQLRREATG